MARAVVAAAQYRADKGKWPDGLEELVPRYMSEVPRERFSATGTEIVGYRKTNAGICLYARAEGKRFAGHRDRRGTGERGQRAVIAIAMGKKRPRIYIRGFGGVLG